ncbi:DoxX [Polystyrenella longa]|uniref:DoxX n=1 Tax=Polystyrenella longa TaxID=2528007 RepID=A0A518CII4_9PLAN|nr:DoxX family protein [Polystyrenella longa]QDU79053.1 DoxX [Polystyrenella longa]
MQKVRYVPLLAIILLVVLRMAIGWQFLYEGLWKTSTQSTSRPWTAAGYLSNAEGPFRDNFRELVGDPDELDWLNEEKVNARWTAWQNRFVKHYDLSEDQQKRLDTLLNGRDMYASDAIVEELPPRVAEYLGENDWSKFFTFNKDQKRLEVDGEWHMTPAERARLIWLAGLEEMDPPPLTSGAFKYNVITISDDGEKIESETVEEPTETQIAFARALDQVYDRQARLGFRERLKGTLKADPEMVGPLYATKIKDEEGKDVRFEERLPGSSEQYQDLLGRFEQMHADATLDYNWVHLDYEKTKMLEQKAKALGPIKSLDSELRTAAIKLVSLDQLSKGPVSPDPEPVQTQDFLVITGLLVLGFCLVAGLFTKLAVLLGAVMVLSFYLVMPPWPGVPQVPGPEHSFVVNKNLIEVFALLAIAAFPTGRWFGIDAAFFALFRKQKTKATTTSVKTETDSSKAAAAT